MDIPNIGIFVGQGIVVSRFLTHALEFCTIVKKHAVVSSKCTLLDAT